MASEQVMNKVIAKAVAEATRVAIQIMAEALAERMHDISVPKLGSPTMKQSTFDWNAEDKYSKLKIFRLEVNHILSTYNTPHTDKLVRKERPQIFRDIDDYRKGNMQHLRRSV